MNRTTQAVRIIEQLVPRLINGVGLQEEGDLRSINSLPHLNDFCEMGAALLVLWRVQQVEQRTKNELIDLETEYNTHYRQMHQSRVELNKRFDTDDDPESREVLRRSLNELDEQMAQAQESFESQKLHLITGFNLLRIEGESARKGFTEGLETLGKIAWKIPDRLSVEVISLMVAEKEADRQEQERRRERSKALIAEAEEMWKTSLRSGSMEERERLERVSHHLERNAQRVAMGEEELPIPEELARKSDVSENSTPPEHDAPISTEEQPLGLA